MTHEEIEAEDVAERHPLSSKKFVAFLVGEVSWKLLMGLLIGMSIREAKIDAWVAAILLSMIVISGFLEVVYIGKQADLDRYVRVAAITKSFLPGSGGPSGQGEAADSEVPDPTGELG